MSEAPIPAAWDAAAWDPPAPPPEFAAATRDQAVVVADVHSTKVSYSWHHSMVQLIGWDMANRGRVATGGFISRECGTDGVVEGRNQNVQQFLDEDRADWLWWVDTDMGFAPDTVDRLFGAADPLLRPIVGALCFSQRQMGQDGFGGHRVGAVPTIFHWAKHKGQQGFVVMWDYPPDALVKCHGTGSACVLIHRSVLQAVRERYGACWYDRLPNPSTGQLIGEDLSFCIRANALGFPMFVHTGVPTSHHKESWVGAHDYWRQRAVDPPPVAPEPEEEPDEAAPAQEAVAE